MLCFIFELQHKKKHHFDQNFVTQRKHLQHNYMEQHFPAKDMY